MSLEELRSQAREGAEKVSEGRFRIDAERALLKLRDFRLVDPHLYVLELLRAGVAAGARSVEVKVDASVLELHLEHVKLPLDVLEDLLSRALSGGDDPDGLRNRLLAYGIAGAMGLRPVSVQVKSSGAMLEVREDGVTFHRKVSGATRGITVRVEERLGLRVLRDAVLTPVEAALIREHASHYPLPLVLNGRPLRPPHRAPGTSVIKARRQDGLEAVVTLAESPPGHTSLTFELLGCAFVTRQTHLPLIDGTVRVRDDRLRRNASGSDVVEDERFGQAMDLVRATHEEAVIAYLEALHDAPERRIDPLRTRIISLVREKRLGSLPRALRDAVEKLPLIPGPSGERVSMHALKEELQRGRSLRYSSRLQPPGTYTQPAVLLDGYRPEFRLLLPAEPRVDIQDEVNARRRGARERTRWEKSPEEEVALRGGYAARGRFAGQRFAGEVGFISEGGVPEPLVEVLCQRRPVSRFAWPKLAPLRIECVVEVQHPIAEAVWSALPGSLQTDDLWTAIINGATEVMTARLSGKGTPSSELSAHALELIAVLAREGKTLEALPEALRELPLVPLLGGARASLSALVAGREVRHVPVASFRPALSGLPVAVIPEHVREPLRRLLGKVRWIPFSDQLRAEEEIHQRLAGPRRLPQLTSRPLVTIPIEAEGLKGEVGIPREPRSNVEVILLREGFQLEITEMNSRYGGLVAAVECPELTPDESWRRAQRDAVFGKVQAAIQDAERNVVAGILAQLQERPVTTLASPVHRYLLTFVRKELVKGRGRGDELEAALLAAPMMPTTQGRRSLEQLRFLFEDRRKVPWLREAPGTNLLGELPILVMDRETAATLVSVVGLELGSAEAELERHRRRAAFKAQRQVPVAVEAPLPIRTEMRQEHVRGEVVFAPQRSTGCDATIYFDGRVLEQRLIASPLPLLGALELHGGELDPGLELDADRIQALIGAVANAESALVRGALAAQEEPAQRALLLAALRGGLDQRLAAPARDALLEAPLFPTVQGPLCSAQELSSNSRVAYVVEALEGALGTDQPVVLATAPDIRDALERWRGRLVDLTDSVRLELYARKRRERLPQVRNVEVTRGALARARIAEGRLEGEVALLDGHGDIQLYQDRRQLCHVKVNGWPEQLAAALEAPNLEPTADHTSVVRNADFRHASEVLLAAADRLGALVADAFLELPKDEQERWAPSVAAFAFWSAARRDASPRLLSLPVLEATDERKLSVADLLKAQRTSGEVGWSRLRGALLEDDAPVWWPRPQEKERARSLRVSLTDRTDELRHAAELRARPKLRTLEVDTDAPWRAPVSGEGIEGEVVLLLPLEPVLRVELARSGILLETLDLEHSMGGAARVQSSGLKLNRDWTQVSRNRAFRDVRDAMEDALESVVHRFLSQATEDPHYASVVTAALRWKLGASTPLGSLLTQLAAFERLDGRPVTVGEVLFEHSRSKVISVADPSLAGRDVRRLVLVGTPEARARLEILDCRIEDVSADIRRSADLDRLRAERRLEDLRYRGDALVTLDVEEEGYRGQLALPLDPAKEPGITLARDGVAVDTFHDRDRMAAGVLTHPELPVDAEWSKAVLTGALRAFLGAKTDALLAALVKAAPRLDVDHLEAAAEYILRFLAGSGLRKAARLSGLDGRAGELARCPVFRLSDGTRVDLLAVADRATQGRQIAVVRSDLVRWGAGGDLAIAASDVGARWVRVLGSVLGPDTLKLIDSADDWEVWTKESDPPETTLLGRGLTRLRREARLLRADAFGQLELEELSDVRLRPGNGKRPVVYDAKRAVALLDPEHPEVKQALEEAERRPDRLYVLLAAVYGAVNRALPKVTDADEARLAAALLAHLAANPRLLDPTA